MAAFRSICLWIDDENWSSLTLAHLKRFTLQGKDTIIKNHRNRKITAPNHILVVGDPDERLENVFRSMGKEVQFIGDPGNWMLDCGYRMYIDCDGYTVDKGYYAKHMSLKSALEHGRIKEGVLHVHTKDMEFQ